MNRQRARPKHDGENRYKTMKRVAGFAALAIATIVIANQHPCAAQTSPISGGFIDPAIVEDLVVANRILADQGVLDGLGHVSIRHPTNPNRYLMSRSLAPALVTSDDIMEYDLDSNSVDARGRSSFIERFIHGEIYKVRPDVMAVVHSHSPSVIPFGISQVPMKATYAMASFLVAGVPVFDIRKAGGAGELLVRNAQFGRALAETLGDKSVVLMRGHGEVVVAASLQMVVLRAIYTEINARLQMQAIMIGGPLTYLDPEEGRKNEANLEVAKARSWELWKRAVSEKTTGK
jgi:ribulose-5-phosphate 4-epimerase/fuculose-1-phosphate aldolase